jgi:hypothetical protein
MGLLTRTLANPIMTLLYIKRVEKMSPWRTVQIHKTPPEAAAIAACFERAAAEVKGGQTPLETVRLNLFTDWLGNAKNIFFTHFSPLPSDYSRYVQTLEHLADQARSIKVLVEEKIWYDDFDLDTPEKSGSATLR